MLTLKMYRTADERILCDGCSMDAIRAIHGLAMSPVPNGTPCTCDSCGIKGRSK